MENTTSVLEFAILPYFMKTNNTLFIFSIVFFFAIYFSGIIMNIIITTVVYLDINLHTPMYLFLCNLSVVDICYTTITVPKLLYILLSDDNKVPFTQCLIQIYFFFIAASAEIMVIFAMAYDRYVAICHPLNYHCILSKNTCVLFVMIIWICSCVNSSLLTNSVLKMTFCTSVTVHQFFCDAKALINISCGGTDTFYILVYANCLLLGFCPALCNMMSYIRIIKVILSIKSNEGRNKAFSTCSSHLTVMAIYYGSAISVYMIPTSESYSVLEQNLTVFYTTVVPVVNPLIYSLRNKDVKQSFRKLVQLNYFLH
ncbi:olfactory receptor 1M1-like [Aquarana catesbeiana]|uniref:olfactory receptor 1M1-like n=1 Tax=Aquarana catesbeiana TaxID=8400 RepID=UPI003CCA481B